MKRRESMGALAALAISAWPARSRAQGVMRRIGLLLPIPVPAVNAAFAKRLASLGWVEGRNLVIEMRHSDSHNERLPGLARELVALKPEVIVASSTPAAKAAKAATSTIPIVFVLVTDPDLGGLVATLAHPGGNLTGVANRTSDVLLKQLELLKALIPKLERVGLLSDPTLNLPVSVFTQLESAGSSIGVKVARYEASTVEAIDAAFETARKDRAAALIVPPAPLFLAKGSRIAELSKRHRIATAHSNRQAVALGGLLSYGIDFVDGFVRAAPYVDRILRGAKPGDLPVEQAERFQGAVNRATANALGLQIPQSVLARVDEVIE